MDARLRRTLWPWSPAGAHLICSAPRNSLSAAVFAQQAERLARQLQALGEPIAEMYSDASQLVFEFSSR